MFRFSVRPNRAHLVNWREWGPEGFREAQQQGKLVVLFITAFWCGFCQRMDENALSDDEVITLLNGFFVPIRVEESQRPDVDLRYNQNGWPTIVFLTSEGGHLLTVNHMDLDSFANMLAKMANLYQEDKEALLGSASSVHGGQGGQQEEEDRAPLAPPLPPPPANDDPPAFSCLIPEPTAAISSATLLMSLTTSSAAISRISRTICSSGPGLN